MVADSKVRETILKIADRIKAQYKPDKIILYGSYAYGRPTEDSDIDMLIIKDTKERPIDRRIAVRVIVSELRRGYPFSPFVITPKELKNRIEFGDKFLEELLLRGEVIYAQ